MSDRCQECHPDLIVRLVRAGDLAALDRISRCYGAHLLAVGRRVCRDDERARDAVHAPASARAAGAGARRLERRPDCSIAPPMWLARQQPGR